MQCHRNWLVFKLTKVSIDLDVAHLMKLQTTAARGLITVGAVDTCLNSLGTWLYYRCRNGYVFTADHVFCSRRQLRKDKRIRQTDRQKNRETDRQTTDGWMEYDGWSDRQTHTSRQTDEKSNRQTVRQTWID